MKEKEQKFYVQSLHRAFQIIEVIADENKKEGIAVTEIAKEVSLPVSTTYRLLQNLLAWDYVRIDKNSRYFLGMKFLQLGGQLQEKLRISDIAHDTMERLNQLTKETIYLAKLDKKDYMVIYIEKLEGMRAVRLSSNVGTKCFVHTTANGKCLISGFCDEEIKRIFLKNNIPIVTANSIHSIEQYLKEIQQVRKNGYAYDDGENEPGVRCVAAPIYDGQKNIVASVSISGIAANITDTLYYGEYTNYILCAAKEISEKLGYYKKEI